MMKKVFCLLLSFVLLLNMTPASTFALSIDSDGPAETAAAAEASVPESSVPESSAPEAKTPESSVPEAKTPESSVPESSIPESSVPESSVPESSVPESSVPESSVPESSIPESSEPETSVPESSVPESSVPESSTPETSVPEASVPETSVPETTVPQTSEPECVCGEGSLVHLEGCHLYAAPVAADVFVKEEGKYFKVDSPVEIKKYTGKTLYLVSGTNFQEIMFHYAGLADIGARFSASEGAYWRLTTAEGGFAGLKNSAKLTLAPLTPVDTKIDVHAELALSIGRYGVTICVVDEIVEAAPGEDGGIPACDCSGKDARISSHEGTCARKLWFRTVFVNKTAQQIYDMWFDLSADEREYVRTLLKESAQAKLEELNKLMEAIGKIIELNGKQFTLPGAGRVTETPEAKQEALYAALNPVSSFAVDSGKEYHFYDLESDSTGTISVSGLLEDNKNKSVIVYHLLKDPAQIADNLPYMELSGEGFEEENAAAKEYSGVDGRVYYEVQIAEVKKNGDITFSTESYSTFIFQVTFEYDGVEVTLAGMTGMKLSELMESLNLNYSIKQVESVEFTEPSLISVEKENGDWMIQSLGAFSTTEWLILNFKDGTSLEIRVTDPPIYYYLSGTDWNMGTKKYDYKGVTYQRATATIDRYGVNGSIIQVYVRPGDAVSGVTGIAWPDGSWDTNKAAEGGYKHDGWEWQWDSPENLALIDPNITQYKKIDIALVDNRTTSPEGVNPNGFKYTLRIHVIPEYKPTLLKDALAESGLQDHLSIQTLPVSLFNFDGTKFNGNRAFQFKGVSQGTSITATTNTAGINSGGDSADMGIFNDTLDEDGYPVFALGDVGQTYVFDDSEQAGKEAHMNVPFEFIFDENTRTYYYSSLLNHAQFVDDENGKRVVLYKEGMSPTDMSIQHPTGLAEGASRSAQTYSGYYPFADINKAFLSTTATEFSWTKWEEQLKIPYADMVSQKFAGNYMVKDLVPTSHVATAESPKTSTINMHYGYSVDGFFYLPSDRMLEGQEMTYSFTGDDDLWVFIDGHLVLDIGGGHTPVIGSFNLKTGKVSISSAQKLTGANSEGTISPYEYTDQFLLDLEDDMMHEIQIFYLERMGGESNCYMRFNLPIIPEQSVTVVNDIVDETGHDLSIELLNPHKYQLSITKSVNEIVTTSIGANTRYLLNGTQERFTDENGYFYLGHGESAVFTDIPRFYEEATNKDEPTYVEVTQVLDTNLMYYKVEMDSNGVFTQEELPENRNLTEVKASKADVPAEGNITVKFTNYIYADPMEFTCEVVGGLDGLVNPDQEFQYMISYAPQVMVHPDLNDPDYDIDNPDVDEVIGSDHHWLTISLKHGETLRLESVPRGIIFRLRAIDPDQGTVSSFDDPIVEYAYTDLNNVAQGSITKTLTFIGQGGEHSEDASLYLEETLNPGSHHMKITNLQRGFVTIRHDGTSDLDPDQSYRYTLKGTNEHNKDISIDILVPGDGEVTIQELIIGDYTVTQKEDWSWRYLVDKNEQTVLNTEFTQFPGGYGKILTYTDTRTNISWLDGNSWCRNIFEEFITAENVGGK